MGGLAGLGIGNLSLRLLCRGTSESKNGSANSSTVDAYRWHDTPPAAALRRSVLAVALVSSIAMAAGGPPAALAAVSRPVVAGALAASLLVALCGALWGCTGGAEGAAGRGGGGARGAYGKVAADDREAHEVELKPFVGDDGTDDENARGDEDYLDEEDGYLADEGETERSAGRSSGKRGGGGGRVEYSTLPPARRSSSGPPRRGVNTTGAGGAAAPPAAGVGKEKTKEAPPAKSMFPAGHTVEL